MLTEASEHALVRWPDRTPFLLIERRARATRVRTLVKAGWIESSASTKRIGVWMKQRAR